MSKIHVSKITEAVSKLCIDANCYLTDDIRNCFLKSLDTEKLEMARTVTEILVENADIARDNCSPICQDTGMAVVFVELGQDVQIEGGSLTEAIHAGVAEGYTKGYLRKSVVKDPIHRINTEDNTPAIIHYDIVPGDKINITVAPKGFGSENMSSLRMLTPSAGIEGVEEVVLNTVTAAGSNPCPPIVVGVGVGGTMEKCALLAKRALLRDIGTKNPDFYWADIEAKLLSRINELGIGPAGLGGELTAMAVNIEVHPTHIAGLPVAVNIGCHVNRHKSAVLSEAGVLFKDDVQKEKGNKNVQSAPKITGKKLNTPLPQAELDALKAGEMVLISGHIYTARDAAHKRLVEMIEKGEEPPFDFNGQIVYYAGPCPAKPGEVIGSVGPTTSGRMDKYSPMLMKQGLKLMLGKGERSAEVKNTIKETKGIYFVAIGGAAAYMARCVKEVEMVAFSDLGAEAIRRLTVEDFPAIVAIDAEGNNIE